ncbi:MAG: ubiquinol-cytochrome c reductase iron-sulfur subunit [Actinobacteria bacterium]|nr:ubiquinol-cytochrome c reductase iron-sulfur subunit [Actinomycetota bacterium]
MRRRSETVVALLLFCSAACAVAFVVFYAIEKLGRNTQYMGLALGGSLAFLAAALIVTGDRLVETEQIEEEYPLPDEAAQEQVDELVADTGRRFTRKRLLGTAAGLAGASLGAALITPAASLGPVLDTDPLTRTPWRRGRRLVDTHGTPLRADEVDPKTFYTAYPEGADHDLIGSPVIVARLDPGRLRLPRDRAAWAPEGIVAYSKICTHAACAVSLFRTPRFPPTQPRPAIVCPCHYSTFDPAEAGKVIFGPAGRPLPQLPLMVTAAGELAAGGNFSGPVGPSWSEVRNRRAT